MTTSSPKYPQAPRTAVHTHRYHPVLARREQIVQTMIDDGMAWFTDHPEFDFEGPNRIDWIDNPTAFPSTPEFKAFEDAIMRRVPAEDYSFTIRRSAINHLGAIRKLGWDGYLAMFAPRELYTWDGTEASIPKGSTHE